MRRNTGHGGTSRHPAPTQTALGKQAARRASLGKAVLQHPVPMGHRCSARLHPQPRQGISVQAGNLGVMLGTPRPCFALPLQASPEAGAQAGSGRFVLTARQ